MPGSSSNKAPERVQVDRDYLRYVRLDGYTLRTWWASSADYGRDNLGYEFRTPSGKVLFSGEDYSPSPSMAIDSDECLRGLLFFLTLTEDSGSDCFDSYTSEQLAFARNEAERLSQWVSDEDDEYPRPAFENLDDWEGA